MKKPFNLIFLLLILCKITVAQQATTVFPKLTGPYLGQKPPGNTPELFAPQIVTTGICETSICFSSSGDEVFFVVSPRSRMPRVILTSKILDSVWTEFEEVPFFDAERSNSYPFLSDDGKKLFFNVWKPDKPDVRRTHEIWYVEKDNNKWSQPQKINFGSEYQSFGQFPSQASNGNLYFSIRKDNSDIFCSTFKNGIYSTPERLSDLVNSPDAEGHLCIAPDESFIIFDSTRKDGSIGGQDLYISFKDENGQWTKAVNLGSQINSQYADLRPWISRDGKYLFFISDRPVESSLSSDVINKEKFKLLFNEPVNGDTNIYWVDASFIKELKPKE